MRRRHYHLDALRIEVLTRKPAAALVRVYAFLDHLGLLPAEERRDADALVLRLSTRPGTVRRSSAGRAAAHDKIRAWNTSNRIFLGCAGHAARLNLLAGVADIVVPPPPARLRKDFLTSVLLLLLRRRGLYALHASGVSRAGVGWLFVGGCGSGKSTQTYNLVRQGWEYLADDALLLQARGEHVEALALRRDLLLNPTPAHAYPELAGSAAPRAAKGKRRIDMREMYPDRLIKRCVPRLLVFPEIVPDSTSRLVPLERAEALARLMAQSVVLALDAEVIPRHLEALSRLARQARSYRLLAGRDLKERPELIAELLGATGEPGPSPLHT